MESARLLCASVTKLRLSASPTTLTTLKTNTWISVPAVKTQTLIKERLVGSEWFTLDEIKPVKPRVCLERFCHNCRPNNIICLIMAYYSQVSFYPSNKHMVKLLHNKSGNTFGSAISFNVSLKTCLALK